MNPVRVESVRRKVPGGSRVVDLCVNGHIVAYRRHQVQPPTTECLWPPIAHWSLGDEAYLHVTRALDAAGVLWTFTTKDEE